MKKFILFVKAVITGDKRTALVLFVPVLLIACTGQPPTVLEIYGETMGTRYSVLIPSDNQEYSVEALLQKIEARLEEINRVMSTYDADSELSQFNRVRSSDWFAISKELAAICSASKQLHQETGGAFDISVGPLVNLWGFGPGDEIKTLPNDEQILKAMNRVGLGKLEVRVEGQSALKKSHVDMYLDLSAIAKGYAVDQIAALLKSYDVDNYLVEIGGEIRASSEKSPGELWQIAIEKPRDDQQSPSFVFPLRDGAVATSGNYRNYREHNGQRFSHAIDPSVGKPVEHNLLSVTVWSSTTMRADALATALLVMGPELGVEWAEKQQIDALFVIAEGNILSTETSGSFFDQVN